MRLLRTRRVALERCLLRVAILQPRPALAFSIRRSTSRAHGPGHHANPSSSPRLATTSQHRSAKPAALSSVPAGGDPASPPRPRPAFQPRATFADALRVLRDGFGFDNFWPEQVPVVKRVLAGEDVVLPWPMLSGRWISYMVCLPLPNDCGCRPRLVSLIECSA